MNKQKLVRQILGDKVYQPLHKSLVKLATHSVVDIDELYSAAKLVPKSVMSFLIRETQDMKKDSTKEIKLPFHENALMNIRKFDSDVYTGDICQDGKIVHEFSLCSIPQLGTHLLSLYELYDESPAVSTEENGRGERSESSHKEASVEASDKLLEDQIKALSDKVDKLMMYAMNQKQPNIVINNSKDLDKSDKTAGKKSQKANIEKIKDIVNKKKIKKSSEGGLMPGMPKPPSAGMKVNGTKGKSTTTTGIMKPKQPKMSVHINTMRPGVGVTVSGLSAGGMGIGKSELTFQKSELYQSCEHCSRPVGDCLCFRALSKPEIVQSVQGSITLKFKEDWDADALQALYRSIKNRKS